MEYTECLTCQQLGVNCDGPNLLAITHPERVEWLDARRNVLGLSKKDVATRAMLSENTVLNFFKLSHADCRLETLCPIVKVMSGGEWTKKPCPHITNPHKDYYEGIIRERDEEIRRLTAEQASHADAIRLRDDQIAHLTKEDEENIRMRRFTEEQLKWKNRVIAILSVALGIAVALIIAALVVDRINPEVGYFWLRGLK